MRLFRGLPIKLMWMFVGVCVGWGMHSAFLYLHVQMLNNLVKQNLSQGINVFREIAEEMGDPSSLFLADQSARLLENVVLTPFFSIVSSNSNDIYRIAHNHDGYVIVTEINEQLPDLSFAITRIYTFQENGIHIVCSFTRDAVSKKLLNCYYSFNGTMTYIDTNGDGIWDISPAVVPQSDSNSETSIKN